MDLYTLDEQLRRVEIFDMYESFIWTERYAAWGDFEFVIASSRGVRDKLFTGVRVTTATSNRVMTIMNVDDSVNDDDIAVLKITGSSIEATLDDRVAMPALASLTTTPSWELVGTPGFIARKLFKEVCVTPGIDPGDNIPFFVDLGTAVTYPDEPTETISVAIEPDSLYNVLVSICSMYNLGFALLVYGSSVYFDVYIGNDKTSRQTVFPPVIFSPELDNLSATNEFTSISDYKNVAYVFAPNGAEMVYADGVDPSVSGFDRRVLLVKADSITLPAGAELTAALIYKGKEELAKHRPNMLFDGEFSQFNAFMFNVDYFLGDLIEVRNSDGVSTSMRVIEHIYVSDVNGVKSYPTLSLDLLVTPGTWDALPSGQVWDDISTYWDSMP